MGNKKRSKQDNDLLDENEIKELREQFKKMIDEMTDEEFLDFSALLMEITRVFENEDWDDEVWLEDDEDWDDDWDEEDDEESFHYDDDALPF